MSRGPAWTELEDSTLVRLHAEGMGWADIGIVIGRSRSSCANRWQLVNAKTPEARQVVMEMTCRTCGETKPIDEFHEHKGILTSARSPRVLVCKVCIREQASNASRVGHGLAPRWKPAGAAMWSPPAEYPDIDYKTRLFEKVKARYEQEPATVEPA